MDDDQFTMANKKPRAKRGTLVAPPGIGLGIKGRFMAPPRGSVKITQSDMLKLHKEAAEEIKEETEIDIKSAHSESNKSHSENLDQSNHSKENEKDDLSKTENNAQFNINIEKLEVNEEKNKQTSDFDFDFNSSTTQNQPKAKDEFWAEDVFESKPNPHNQNKDSFDEFNWGGQTKQPTSQQEDFGWESKEKPTTNDDSFEFNKNEAQSTQNKANEDWGFSNSAPTKDIESKPDADFDYNFESHHQNTEDTPDEVEEKQEIKTKDENEDQIHKTDEGIHQNVNVEQTSNSPENEEPEDASNIKKLADQLVNQQIEMLISDTNELNQSEEVDGQNDFDQFEKESNKMKESLSPTKKDSFDNFNFGDSQNINTDITALKVENEFEEKKQDMNNFNFNTNEEHDDQKVEEHRDHFQVTPKIESKMTDDFDFNFKNATQIQNSESMHDDFNFGINSVIKSDDFDFDFGRGSKKQLSEIKSDGFDSFFNKPPTQDKKAPVDSFDLSHETKVQLNNEGNWGKNESSQIEESKEKEVIEDPHPAPKMIKITNENTQVVFSVPKGIPRKSSLELHEFTEETNSFMEE